MARKPKARSKKKPERPRNRRSAEGDGNGAQQGNGAGQNASGRGQPENGPAGNQAETRAHFASKDTFNDLLKLYHEIYRDGGSAPQVTDAITQALLTVMGSGPAFAALETFVSASQANGRMYQSAVASQQMTNIYAMGTLSRCVKAILNLDGEWPEAELTEAELTGAMPGA